MYYSEELKNKYARQFAGLTFSDNFMFSRVMENIDIAKDVIRIILGDEIAEILSVESEKVIKVLPGKHGVRYDIRVKTKTGECIYNIEMQQKDERNTPKRSRYYQATSDSSYLRQGLNYNMLPTHYTVFICKFDPFGLNEALYRFYNYDPEHNLSLDDGTYKLFLNTKGNSTPNKEMNNLMRYIDDGTVSDDTTAKIDNEVRVIRNSSDDFIEYIDTLMLKSEAEAKGEAKGKAKMLKYLVSLGHTVKQLSEMFEMPEKEIEYLLAMDV